MLGKFEFTVSFELEQVNLSQAWCFKLEIDRFIKSHPTVMNYWSHVSFPVPKTFEPGSAVCDQKPPISTDLDSDQET